MSEDATSRGARVVTVAAGLERTGQETPVREAHWSTFYDSFGHVHTSRVEIEANVIRWVGECTRCTVTLTDDSLSQMAQHESSADGLVWSPPMEVTLASAPERIA